MKTPQSSLPPGFRFHPTDEELILHYLRKKVTSTPFPVSVIADVDIYKFDPWNLPGMADFGEKEWYFFSPRDRKYPNGARPNRAAASGYWKATGTDKIIMAPTTAVTGGGGGGMQENIGVKKALVFYRGKPPKGVKTNWIMHEYRLADSLNCYNNNSPIRSNNLPNMRLDHWVLCRIYKKSNVSSSSPSVTASGEYQEEEDEQQLVQDSPLPPLISPISHQKGLVSQKSCSFSNLMDAIDYSYLSNFLSDNSQTGLDDTPNQHFLSNNGTISSSSSSLVPVNESNKLKRENTTFDQDFMVQQHPSKKSNNYRSFPGNNQSDRPQQQQQQNFLNHKFLNQQLLLSPYLQYQG